MTNLRIIMQNRSIARAVQAVFLMILVMFTAADATATPSVVQLCVFEPANVSDGDAASGEGMFSGLLRQTNHMGGGAPVDKPDDSLALAAVGLLVGVARKRMAETTEIVEELSPEDLDTAERIAGDWAEILMPYFTDVTPQAAKDNAFEIVAVGMAGRQQLEHQLEAIKEDQLSRTYSE